MGKIAMRFPIWITILSALIGLGFVFVIGRLFIQPDLPLIITASFDEDRITPNADGEADVTTFRYELSRNANVSLTFENDAGQVFYFRNNQSRTARDYEVFFSGVVDGYHIEGEDYPDDLTIERRLIPDGVYTWRLTAENDTEQEEISGTFTIEDADSPLPLISTFTLSSPEFTPNQDGVTDRVIINVFLEKDADLRAFLLNEAGQELPIVEREEWSRDGEAGRYTFDYEGGVDLGKDPPPDGTYTIVVMAQDDEGQRIRRESELTILLGGKPRAEIYPQPVGVDVFYTMQTYDDRYYSDQDGLGDLIALPEYPEAVNVTMVTVPLGDMLAFRLTVNNYSDVPLRTTGPPPGAVYQQDQVAAALGALEEPGAWRIGIECDTSPSSYPYRWAIGTEDDLITIVDTNTGREFRYLPPQTKSVVWGAIRLTEINEYANPQFCRVGLIHEQVGISIENQAVDPRYIQIVDTNGNDSD